MRQKEKYNIKCQNLDFICILLYFFCIVYVFATIATIVVVVVLLFLFLFSMVRDPLFFEIALYIKFYV